jgi:hypothetical protein
MRIAAMITIAGLTGIRTQAGEIEKPATQTVMVCMQTGVVPALHLAQDTAAKLFARQTGLKLAWHRDERSCAPESIVITLTSVTRHEFHPGAFALALPYEGLHIRVFYDRIREVREARRMSFLLAYVLVHEITHILQGCNRHSETGIMKARWSPKDFDRMALLELTFMEEDVRLIYLGLASRARRKTTFLEVR